MPLWPSKAAASCSSTSTLRARCRWALASPHELDATVYNLLMERSLSAHDVIIKTRVDGMDLMPSNIDLSGAEVQLVHEVGREFVLGRVLSRSFPTTTSS